MNYKRLFISILAILLLIVLSAFSLVRINYEKARMNNVCKTLKGDVLIYLIFVDSRETTPWTEFDIQSTLDSVLISIDWLESHARRNSISLNIKTDYYIGEEYSTITRRLPAPSVYLSATEPGFNEGMENLNKWADRIARMAGSTFPTNSRDGIPEIDQPRNKERLIAYLRDRHMTESVALLYMLNNYYKDDISISINTMTDEDVEFAVVSYKNPLEISKSILSLFGAIELNNNIFKRSKNQLEHAGKYFKNDIMYTHSNTHNIHNKDIGSFTRYMIGWSSQLDPAHKLLLQPNSFLDF